MSIAEYHSPCMALGEGCREASGSARSLYEARDGVVEGSVAGVKAVLGDGEEKAASRSMARGFLPPSAKERLGEENPYGSGAPAIGAVIDAFSGAGEPAGAKEDGNLGNEAEKGIRRGSVVFGRSFRRPIIVRRRYGRLSSGRRTRLGVPRGLNGARERRLAAGRGAERGARAVRETGRKALRLGAKASSRAGVAVLIAVVVLAVCTGAYSQVRAEFGDAELSVAARLLSEGYSAEAVAGVLGNLCIDGYFEDARPGDFKVTESKYSGRVAERFGHAKGALEGCYESLEDFRGAQDVRRAAWSWFACYESPLVFDTDGFARRAEAAEAYLALLGGQDLRTLAILASAYSQLGVDYVWGWAKPYVGLDCSGLTMWCYRQAGITIPKHSESQARMLAHIDLEDARPGDILWRSGHVAIYLGDDRYIHAMDEEHGVLFGEGKAKFTCALRYVE